MLFSAPPSMILAPFFQLFFLPTKVLEKWSTPLKWVARVRERSRELKKTWFPLPTNLKPTWRPWKPTKHLSLVNVEVGISWTRNLWHYCGRCSQFIIFLIPIFPSSKQNAIPSICSTPSPPVLRHTHTHTHLHFTFYNQEAPVPSPCFLSTDHILSKIPLHPLHFQYFHHHLFLKLMQIFPPPNNVAKLVSSPSFSS